MDEIAMKTSSPTSPYAPDLGQLKAWLEKMIASLQFAQLIVAILALFTKMRDLKVELVKQLAHLRRARPRSETLERVERQLVLPLGAIAASKPAPKMKDDESEKDKTEKKRRGGGRGTLPAHLERVQIVNAVPAEARICPQCGAKMTTVGHSKCERLDVIPARLVVVERLDERVACPKDDTIVSALVPPAIVEGGKLGDTLIVESLCDKYIEHQPVERQCTRFARAGVDIAPQTLGRSVAAAIDLQRPISSLIEEQTRAPGLLGTDATSIPILDPNATDGIRNGAMWCWTNAYWVTSFYAPSADSESVRRFLGDNLVRSVQCDGTSVTNFLERAGGTRPGCWSHGRRRLVDAAWAGDQLALEGLRIIARLFAIERCSALDGDGTKQRRIRRQEQSRPVLDDLRAWLDEHRGIVPPKTRSAKHSDTCISNGTDCGSS
jgi:transposase